MPNSRERHQRSFSHWPCKRPLHFQLRSLSSDGLHKGPSDSCPPWPPALRGPRRSPTNGKTEQITASRLRIPPDGEHKKESIKGYPNQPHPLPSDNPLTIEHKGERPSPGVDAGFVGQRFSPRHLPKLNSGMTTLAVSMSTRSITSISNNPQHLLIRMAASGRDRVYTGFAASRLCATGAIPPKVSYLAPLRSHAAGQERSLLKRGSSRSTFKFAIVFTDHPRVQTAKDETPT